MIDRDLGNADAIEKAFIEACIRHNQHQAGEKNRPQPLMNFQYGVGFVFERPNGMLWRVERVFPREQQAFMQTLDRKHTELWDGGRMVQLPSIYGKV